MQDVMWPLHALIVTHTVSRTDVAETNCFVFQVNLLKSARNLSQQHDRFTDTTDGDTRLSLSFWDAIFTDKTVWGEKKSVTQLPVCRLPLCLRLTLNNTMDT